MNLCSHSEQIYFVHSFCALPTTSNSDWALALTDYGEHTYISMVAKGNVVAAQFHPEKSGSVGLAMINSFLCRKVSSYVSSSNTFTVVVYACMYVNNI